MLSALSLQSHFGLVEDLQDLIILGVAVGGPVHLALHVFLRLLFLGPHGLPHDG